MNFVQIRPFLEDSKEVVFSKNNVKKCDYLVNKNGDFAKKRSDLVDKSTPSNPHPTSPKTGHPICDHSELIFTGKNTKSEQN